MYRSDPVEISAGGAEELNDVAEVLLYFSTPPGLRFMQFAFVRYYTVVENEHLLLKVPYLKKRDVAKKESYGCLDIATITGHAHIVPDFDTPGKYFWDLVQ